MTAACPICAAPATPVHDLSASDIRARLAQVFDEMPPADVVEDDYTVCECSACHLVFADPMKAGSGVFYGWVTGFARYHAGARKEWTTIRTRLSKAGALRILDVGAGQGMLMAFLGDLPGADLVGIDVSAASVQAARAKGLDVREAPFEAMQTVLAADETFDAVILSHVLEHVADPLRVARLIRDRLRPGGLMLAAVPYSPMSRERDGWDIMNLPPHHMTRWNARSLTKLAEVLDMTLELDSPRAKSPLKRAVQDTCGQVLGTKHPSIWRRLWVVLGHFGLFASLWTGHRRREHVNGRPAGDSVLAIFTRR